MEFAQGLVLFAATLTMGLAAGFLYAYAHDIMPGLGSSDDRTFVAGFQAVDRAVINPWFMAGFLGAPLLTGVAILLQAGDDGDREVMWWSFAAFVLYFFVIAITRRVHLPLNAEIQAAGDPDRIADLAAVRQRFEARWVRWHIVRTVANVAAFGCLLWALVLFGRGT
jgi:uncharacterized membrane protein